MTAADVIAGKAKWSAEVSDALDWLRSLPDDSIDLLFTSPPYEKCRTYGIGEKMVGGQAWVDWMVAVVTAAAPKVKGLIAINCEGQTRGYRYSCVPFLLMADLHRAGFNLRKPCIYERDGIPGSGGPDWLKNRWEPIICITRRGRLPWSNNVACGHKPTWHAGGVSNNRKPDGTRKPAPKYAKPDLANPGNVLRFRHDKNGNVKGAHARDICEIANPGNIIQCVVGGGALGHACAHDNEAPFPLELPAFFIKSFCPPDGIVADCFAGSGSAIDAAVQHGRRGIGCDIRQSQIELIEKRMATVTPALFA